MRVYIFFFFLSSFGERILAKRARYRVEVADGLYILFKWYVIPENLWVSVDVSSRVEVVSRDNKLLISRMIEKEKKKEGKKRKRTA